MNADGDPAHIVDDRGLIVHLDGFVDLVVEILTLFSLETLLGQKRYWIHLLLYLLLVEVVDLNCFDCEGLDHIGLLLDAEVMGL